MGGVRGFVGKRRDSARRAAAQPCEDLLARLAQDGIAVELRDDVLHRALGTGFAPGLAGDEIAFGGAADDLRRVPGQRALRTGGQQRRNAYACHFQRRGDQMHAQIAPMSAASWAQIVRISWPASRRVSGMP